MVTLAMQNFWKCFFLLIILSTQTTSIAWGEIVPGFLKWKPHPKAQAQLLPLKMNETFEAAVRRYINALQEHKELKKLFQNTQFKISNINFDKIEFLNLNEIKNKKSVQILILANYLNDMAPNHARSQTIIKPLEFFGAKTYMLAPAFEAGLSQSDAEEFRQVIVNTFDSIIALGGDDVHPNLYQEKVTYSHLDQLNLARDQIELKLIRAFNQKQSGVFYGICRGSQLCAVSEGAKLIQDLKKEQGVIKEHWFNKHPVYFTDNERNLLSILLGQKQIETFSAHHQAIIPNTGKIIPIAFYGKDNELVIEGWQLKNGLGFGVQFHPELFTQDSSNRELLKAMVQYAGFIKSMKQSNFKLTCKNIFNLLLLSKK